MAIKFESVVDKSPKVINIYGGNLEAFKSKGRFVILVGGGGTGKMEWVENLIPTPSGWKKFGDLEIGDEIFSEKGSITKVLEIHPQGRKQLYKVEFNDGSFVEVGGEHLWTVWTEKQRDISLLKDKKGRTGNPKVLTTLQIKENIHKRFTIPITQAVQYPKKDLIIDPYVMGIIIGDGCIRDTCLGITSADEFILNKVKSKLIDNHSLKQNKNSKYDFRIITNGSRNSYIKYFNRKIIKSTDKFIPSEYLQSSIEDRIELLQGLMDSDGYIDKKGILLYTTVSEKLCNDFKELIQSLGGICKIKTKIPKYTYKGEKKEGKLSYNIHVNLPNGIQACSLPRKIERLNLNNRKYLPMRKIISIEPTEIKEAMCIAVDNPNELYLTKDFIVTHNTFAMCLKMHLYAIKYPGVKILLCRKSLPALRNSVVKTYLNILEQTGYEDRVRTLGETRPTEFHYLYDEKEYNGVVYKGKSTIVLSQIDLQGKALGAEYDMIYVNQPDTEGLTEDEFTLIASRARLQNAPYRQILADPNPASETHWLLKGSLPDVNGKIKWNLFSSIHQDNPVFYDQEKQEWTEAGIEHLEQLELLPDYLRQSQLEGKWFNTEGTAFANSWNPSKHLISLSSQKAINLNLSKFNEETGEYENTVPQGWHHYLSIDWGGSDPFAILLIARHPDQDLFIVHKHIYIVEADIVKVANLTKQMIEGYEIKNIIADRGRIETKFMENVLGIPITNAKKGAGSVEDSINICNTELLSDRWLFVHTSESLFNEPSRELINKKRLMGVEEIPNLKIDPKTRGIAKHQQDHYFDSLKYFMRYWAELENSYHQPALLWL